MSYQTTEQRLKIRDHYVPQTHRDELYAIWRSLRKFQTQEVKHGGIKLRRVNPRYISDIQNIKLLHDFYAWARKRNWRPGTVPIYIRKTLIPDTALSFTSTAIWQKGKLLLTRTVSPIYRPPGTVPKWQWVADYEVSFITVQALHRRRNAPADMPAYSRKRLADYRRQSKKVKSKLVAFGESKSLRSWSADPRCNVSLSTLARRIAKGVPAERAMQ
jgi:hypothetical protein